MKKITNLLYAAFVAVLSAGFVSCEETAPVYEPGSQDLEGCYGVYFPTQEAAGAHTLDPTAAKEVKVVVMRQNAEDSITVPVNAIATIGGVPVAADSIFNVPAVVFEDGQLEDTITVTFPNVETAVNYGLTLEVTDPAYASLFGKKPVSLSFSVFCVEWKYVAVDEDGNQSFVTDESKAATVNFVQGFWGEVVDDVKIKYYEVNGVLNCVAYRDGDSFFPETDTRVEFNFTMKTKPNGEDKYDIDVKKQYMGWDYQGTDPVYFYDWYNYMNFDNPNYLGWWPEPENFYSANGASYPRSYYDGMGGYYFNLAYQVPSLGGGFTADKFDLVGIVNGVLRQDFTTIITIGETVEGAVPVTFAMGKDVASVKYTVLEGEVTDKVAKAYCDSIIADTTGIYPVVTPENTTFALELAASGIYTLVAVPFDAAGEAQQPAKDVNFLAVPFTYVAAADAEDYAAVVTLGIENTSAMYAKDGYTDVNSFEFYVYGKDIVEVKYNLLTTEEYAINPDSCNALVAAEGKAFSAEMLELVNAGGLSDLMVGLKANTSYTMIVWASNGYNSTFATAEYTTSGLPLELVGTGTYTYTCMFNEPLVDPGYSLYKDPNYKDTYKITNWFYGVDFTFTWDGDSIVNVPDQFSGYVSQYGDVNVMELSDYVGREMSPSYYNAETKTFYFGVVYYCAAGEFGYGYETFTVDGSQPAYARQLRRSTASSLNTQWGVREVKAVGPQIAGKTTARDMAKKAEFTVKAVKHSGKALKLSNAKNAVIR